jgi:hypothetical protein
MIRTFTVLCWCFKVFLNDANKVEPAFCIFLACVAILMPLCLNWSTIAGQISKTRNLFDKGSVID